MKLKELVEAQTLRFEGDERDEVGLLFMVQQQQNLRKRQGSQVTTRMC
jgi:hypothetical protein